MVSAAYGWISRYLFYGKDQAASPDSALLASADALSRHQPELAINHLLAWPQAPSKLEATDPADVDHAWLLLQCFWALQQPLAFRRQLKALAHWVPAEDWRVQHGLLQLQLIQGVQRAPSSLVLTLIEHHGAQHLPHLALAAIQVCLDVGAIPLADRLLAPFCAVHTSDLCRMRAQLLEIQGELTRAEERLLSHFHHGVQSRRYCEQLVDLLFRLRREQTSLPVLKQALAQHGVSSSPLLSRFAEAKLMQCQAAPGLRAKLLERLQNSVGAEQQPPTALSTGYDMLGRTEWFAHIHPELIERPGMAANLASNLMMHCSSHAIRSYPHLAKNLSAFFAKQWQSLGSDLAWTPVTPVPKSRLKIAWICGDIANHPVFRFVYSWWVASQGQRQHEHWLLATHPPSAEHARWVQELPDVQWLDLSHISTMPEFVRAVRAQGCDVVIDLNGWTANNIGPAFQARLAPLQINYLAFHASTGNPSMDAWIVDHALLPANNSQLEWHTERLVRLSRPFLAWQPAPLLPEAQCQAVAPICFDQHDPIRFGCFNHARKISTAALQLWAELLRRIPDAQLVLKAFAGEDAETAELLQRRLLRAGLDLARIHFLPYTATPYEHLQQYGQMDIALDSFPNTGCTTTCEALWMGVPVLTLCGDHYVSRMGHAVVCAAGLEDWSVPNPDAFWQKAQGEAQPQRLQWLRSNRSHWRQQLQRSPLGDAAGLMQHLEQTIERLWCDSAHDAATIASR